MGQKQPISSKAQLTISLFRREMMLPRALLARFIQKSSTVSPFQFNQQAYYCVFIVLVSCFKIYAYLMDLEILQRALHSRNKKALEFIAKGWNALKEVDRVIDYCELNDKRLIPLLRVMSALSTYSYLLLYLRFHIRETNKLLIWGTMLDS